MAKLLAELSLELRDLLLHLNVRCLFEAQVLDHTLLLALECVDFLGHLKDVGATSGTKADHECLHRMGEVVDLRCSFGT